LSKAAGWRRRLFFVYGFSQAVEITNLWLNGLHAVMKKFLYNQFTSPIQGNYC